MDLKKIRIDASPLTNRIRIARVGKDGTVALDTRDATGECIGAVINHVMHGCPDGATLNVTAPDGKTYELTVRPVDAATPAPAEASEGWIAFPKDMTDDMAEAIAFAANVCGGIAHDVWVKLMAQGVPVAAPASAREA